MIGYYLIDNYECLASIQETRHFYFWRRWKYVVGFYDNMKLKAHTRIKGFCKTESEARDTVRRLYSKRVFGQ